MLNRMLFWIALQAVTLNWFSTLPVMTLSIQSSKNKLSRQSKLSIKAQEYFPIILKLQCALFQCNLQHLARLTSPIISLTK